MPRTTITALSARVDSLDAKLDAILARLDAPVAAPARGKAKSAVRTFATKAERAAGKGFACSCGRADLRVAPHAGSFHRAPDGSTHTVE